MKKLLPAILALLLLAVMALPAFAAESTATVYTDTESAIIYSVSGGTWDNGSARVVEGSDYIIYVFTLDAGDKYASLSLPICNQYKIEAAKSDPDNAASYTVVAQKEKTPEEVTTSVPYWGAADYAGPLSVKLDDFCKDNTTGKIYVKISDAAPENGWGPQLHRADPIVFTHSGDVAEVQTFTAGEASEDSFIYKNERTWVDSRNRICDNDTYVIYAFDTVKGANFAELAINIHNQYRIEVATADPDNAASYEVVEELEIPGTADLTAEPWWGSSDAYELHTINLSKYCGTGKIYVKISDVTPDTGWGGKIEGEVSFTSKVKTSAETADGLTGILAVTVLAAGAVVYAKKKH